MQNVISFIFGALAVIVASWISHVFILNRETRARKIDFRGFLGRWLSDIQRAPRRDDIATYHAYARYIQDFHGYAAKLSKDFYRKRRFKTLCDDLGKLEPRHIGIGNEKGGDCREVVTRKIEALIDFV